MDLVSNCSCLSNAYMHVAILVGITLILFDGRRRHDLATDLVLFKFYSS